MFGSGKVPTITGNYFFEEMARNRQILYPSFDSNNQFPPQNAFKPPASFQSSTSTTNVQMPSNFAPSGSGLVSDLLGQNPSSTAPSFSTFGNNSFFGTSASATSGSTNSISSSFSNGQSGDRLSFSSSSSCVYNGSFLDSGAQPGFEHTTTSSSLGSQYTESTRFRSNPSAEIRQSSASTTNQFNFTFPSAPSTTNATVNQPSPFPGPSITPPASSGTGPSGTGPSNSSSFSFTFSNPHHQTLSTSGSSDRSSTSFIFGPLHGGQIPRNYVSQSSNSTTSSGNTRGIGTSMPSRPFEVISARPPHTSVRAEALARVILGDTAPQGGNSSTSNNSTANSTPAMRNQNIGILGTSSNLTLSATSSIAAAGSSSAIPASGTSRAVSLAQEIFESLPQGNTTTSNPLFSLSAERAESLTAALFPQTQQPRGNGSLSSISSSNFTAPQNNIRTASSSGTNGPSFTFTFASAQIPLAAPASNPSNMGITSISSSSNSASTNTTIQPASTRTPATTRIFTPEELIIVGEYLTIPKPEMRTIIQRPKAIWLIIKYINVCFIMNIKTSKIPWIANIMRHENLNKFLTFMKRVEYNNMQTGIGEYKPTQEDYSNIRLATRSRGMEAFEKLIVKAIGPELDINKIVKKVTRQSVVKLITEENGETACSICLDEFIDGKEEDELAKTICEHVFHYECINGWLNRKPTCPNCRKEFL